MLKVYCGLSPFGNEKLIKYTDFYQRFHTRVLNNFLGEIYMHEPEEPSKYMRWRGTLSFSYECVMDVDSQLELIVCS